MSLTITPVAHICSDFPTKFGIPRQSGIAEALTAYVVFDSPFNDPNALRGIDGFSHLWLIWEFTEAKHDEWSPTVRPPRLGGNARMGVFATRSPFRPNSLGLSCVRLLGVEMLPGRGLALKVGGADLMDGTPIYDVKPYHPTADCHPEAAGGFVTQVKSRTVGVTIPEAVRACFLPDKLTALTQVLAQDPRPSYQDDPTRVYGFGFAGFEVRFTVAGDCLTVVSAEPCGN